MPDQVQLRGGTEADNDGFTGVAREVTVDTTNKTLRVHDGTTSGGSKLAAYDAWGRLQVADPVDATDAASKSYVDTTVAGSLTSEGFRAYRSTTQSLSATTYTKVVFDTEERDEGADYDNATGEWTVPATGWYDVAARVAFASLADGNRAIVALRVDGTDHSRLADITVGGANSGGFGMSLPIHLTAGEVVTIYAWRTSSGNVGNGSHETYFTAKRRYMA